MNRKTNNLRIEPIQAFVPTIAPISPENPATIPAEKVAELLGTVKENIPILVRGKVLKPLGNPQRNTVKFFHRPTIELLAASPDFCSLFRQALYDYNHERNERKKELRAARKAAKEGKELSNIVPFRRGDNSAS